MQRYLTPILQAALSQNPHIQGAAFDVLNHIVRQGLAHPLQVCPLLVLDHHFVLIVFGFSHSLS
jgi:cohesin loading factor subunit SCC2